MKDDKFDLFFRPVKKKAPPPKKEAPPPKKTEQKESKVLSQNTVDEMFERMNAMKSEVEEKLQNIYSKANLTQETILKNAKTIGSSAWEQVQKDKDKLEQAMWSALGQEAKIKKQKKELDKTSKARKTKSVGTRKKWIPMR